MFTINAATKSSVAQTLIQSAVKEGDKTIIYRLKPRKIEELTRNVRSCVMVSEYDCANKCLNEEKTIMFLGATGAGKSTLIDAMLNYVAAVSYADEYRLKLIQLTDDEALKENSKFTSQTNGITCYKIPKKEGFAIRHALNLIDTPGFGDTRGVEFDKEISKLMQSLFEKQIETIDAICIVVPMSCVRLTEQQTYVFTSVLNIFGKDITNNIFAFLTFDDGGAPDVLEALKEAKVPCKESNHFRFNNSDLFQQNCSEATWRSRTKTFEGFFRALNRVESQSLMLTKKVIISRECIKICLASIQKKIKDQVQMISAIKVHYDTLLEHKADIENNKNFEIKTRVPVTVKEKTKHPALVCKKHQHTCHENCSVWANAFIYSCKMMTWGGNCKVCNEECGVGSHSLEDFFYKSIIECKTVTLYDMRDKYNLSQEKANLKEKLLNIKKKEMKESLTDLDRKFQQVRDYLKRLKEIALQKDNIGLDDYIDDLINKEYISREPDFEKRVEIIKRIKGKINKGSNIAEMVDEII